MGFPRDVSIEYRISSTTVGATVAVTYTDAEGGDAHETEVQLPTAFEVDCEVHEFDGLYLSASVDPAEPMPTDLHLEIDVGGELVASQTDLSERYASVIYSFE